jgi:hypothetical protein
MEPNEVRKTYKLGSDGNLTATILITRAGQEPADVGNGVVVNGRIILPINEKSELDDRIRFGRNVKLLGFCLDRHWGVTDAGGVRVGKDFSAPRWHIAFKEAEEYLTSEMGRLLAAIAAREAALVAAEMDD